METTQPPPHWAPGQPLPNAEHAIIPPEKLRDYALNPAHPRGAAKAVAFRRVLGYTQQGWAQLRDALITALATVPASQRGATEYGTLYSADMAITGPSGRVATVRTGWIIRHGESAPRLTSAYVVRPGRGTLGSSKGS